MVGGGVHDKLSLPGWAPSVISSVRGGVEMLLFSGIHPTSNDPFLRQFYGEAVELPAGGNNVDDRPDLFMAGCQSGA